MSDVLKRVSDGLGKVSDSLSTLSHLRSFIDSAVPPIRLFLMMIMMTLKRCVAKENYFIAVLRYEATNNFLMSGP